MSWPLAQLLLEKHSNRLAFGSRLVDLVFLPKSTQSWSPQSLHSLFLTSLSLSKRATKLFAREKPPPAA